jgi:hypothetical protein
LYVGSRVFIHALRLIIGGYRLSTTQRQSLLDASVIPIIITAADKPKQLYTLLLIYT